MDLSHLDGRSCKETKYAYTRFILTRTRNVVSTSSLSRLTYSGSRRHMLLASLEGERLEINISNIILHERN